MERRRYKSSMVIWVLLVGLSSHNMVMCTNSDEGVTDQKNYYSPDPHKGGTPKSPHKRSHKKPSCGTPPSNGGGGGGYYHPPPSYGGGPPIVTPPTVVSPPSYGGQTPPSISPPTIEPGTPSTPMIPNTPPIIIGTCNFWRTHPQLIWGLFGYWGTVGGVFGVPALLPNLSLQQALSYTRTDGLGSLYREGTASLLNSLASNKFPYTTQQVKDRFLASLSSDKAAATQAQLFKLANEGRIKIKP